MTHFGIRTSLRFTPLGEMRGTDLALFAYRDAEALKSSPTPRQPWAPPLNQHARVGTDGISALAPQTKLCHLRIRSCRLGRNTGKVGGGKGLGCRLVFLAPASEKWELRSGTVKGKNYSPSFPSSGAEGANLPGHWHRQCCHGDFAAFSMCCPRQVPPPRLRAGCTWQYFLPGAKRNQWSRWRTTCSTLPAYNQSHAIIYFKKYFSFYFTVKLLCKSLGVLRCLTVKIHMMHLH